MGFSEIAWVCSQNRTVVVGLPGRLVPSVTRSCQEHVVINEYFMEVESPWPIPSSRKP